MLNIGRLSPGAADYYLGEITSSAEDYYTGRGETPDRWVGSNMTPADAICVALAEHLGADFLTGDHNLAAGPTFPRHLNVLRLPPDPEARQGAAGWRARGWTSPGRGRALATRRGTVETVFPGAIIAQS